MDTIGMTHFVATFDPVAAIGLGRGDHLPGGLAVTAMMLLVIAIWSLFGARGPRRTP